MSSEFGPALSQATMSTVESMCFTAVMDTASPSADFLGCGAEVCFTGDSQGRIRVELTPDAATAVASGFLGMEPEDLDESAASTVLMELANMICGCMLSLHNPTGSFAISSPVAPESSCPVDAAETCSFELETGIIRVSFAHGDPPQ